MLSLNSVLRVQLWRVRLRCAEPSRTYDLGETLGFCPLRG